MFESKAITDQPSLVFDGGLGTLLSEKEYGIEGDPLWSARMLIDNHQALADVHYNFLEAGADVVQAGTYQASIAGFLECTGCTVEQAEEYLWSGARVVIEARDAFWSECRRCSDTDSDLHIEKEERIRPFVAASLGPYGVFLHDGSEYDGSYIDHVPLQDIKDWHRARLSVLHRADLDLFMFDTIPSLTEGHLITDVLREFPNLKASISFSAQSARALSHGELFADAVKTVALCPQAIAVGINCTDSSHVGPLLSHICYKRMDQHVLVKPNSGEKWVNKRWSGERSLNLETQVPCWMKKGAAWIGGCCRTTPADISTIRRMMTQNARALVD